MSNKNESGTVAKTQKFCKPNRVPSEAATLFTLRSYHLPFSMSRTPSVPRKVDIVDSYMIFAKLVVLPSQRLVRTEIPPMARVLVVYRWIKINCQPISHRACVYSALPARAMQAASQNTRHAPCKKISSHQGSNLDHDTLVPVHWPTELANFLI